MALAMIDHPLCEPPRGGSQHGLLHAAQSRTDAVGVIVDFAALRLYPPTTTATVPSGPDQRHRWHSPSSVTPMRSNVTDVIHHD